MIKNPKAEVLLELDGPLAFITLNRPAKRNALSEGVMSALVTALRETGKNVEARAVILRANGTIFSSGHDLSELVNRTVTEYKRIFETCVELMETIHEIPQPVIAQVQGPATAAGCQLVATCDLAVAAETAWFATPGVKIGLFCSTPMVPVTRAVSRKKAMQMLLTGEPISAADAVQSGLINAAVPAARLEGAVRDLAHAIADSSPNIIALGKEAFYRQIDMPEKKAYTYTREVMTFNALMQDAHEGITAFLQKRKPRWPRKRS
ncbi:MAG: enoyl-CoA hydratase [Candidatus Eremiobacteraeota bacterium]|nr:enoyl-CoA hydratase [Candidatus Eremiobacteraeota bacterium]MBV8282596.1 enoyl-CoA hydratase [Candidatus Eremiobacteraeota bacterium]